MRRRTAILVLITLAIAALGSFSLHRATFRVGEMHDDGLHCEQPNFNFGQFGPESPALSHTFLLENRTGASLRIIQTQTTCGCTVASYPAREIPPHSNIPLLVTARWWNRAGPQAERISVSTVPSGKAPLILTITGDGIPGLLVTPNDIDFGLLPPGPSSERIIHVYGGQGGTPPELGAAHATDPAVRIRHIKPKRPPAQSADTELGVVVDAPRQPGVFEGVVFVTTAGLPSHQIPVRIHANFAGAITPSIRSIYFDQPDGPQTKGLVVGMADGDAPLTATILPTDAAPAFHLKTRSPIPNNARPAEVDVEFIPTASPTRTWIGTLRLSRGADVLDVPLVAIIKSRGLAPQNIQVPGKDRREP